MQLHRRARKWLDLEIELEDVHGTPITGASLECSFDSGATWIDADTSDSSYRWLLDGPLYDPSETGMPATPGGITPTTITANTTYSVRAVANPEVEVATGKIWLV